MLWAYIKVVTFVLYMPETSWEFFSDILHFENLVGLLEIKLI